MVYSLFLPSSGSVASAAHMMGRHVFGDLMVLCNFLICSRISENYGLLISHKGDFIHVTETCEFYPPTCALHTAMSVCCLLSMTIPFFFSHHHSLIHLSVEQVMHQISHLAMTCLLPDCGLFSCTCPSLKFFIELAKQCLSPRISRQVNLGQFLPPCPIFRRTALRRMTFLVTKQSMYFAKSAFMP